MTGTEKREAIFKQFIEQYTTPFNNQIDEIPAGIPIAKALYLFCFSDYFGKITYVRDTGDISNQEKAKHNFTYLIKTYFPSEYQNSADKIYTLYRCGVMHTVFPKGRALSFDQGNEKLFFEVEVGIPTQLYTIESLNLWKYEQILKSFINNFFSNLSDDQIDNMYKLLTDDIFNDKSKSDQYDIN
jgi:hypothetical protein